MYGTYFVYIQYFPHCIDQDLRTAGIDTRICSGLFLNNIVFVFDAESPLLLCFMSFSFTFRKIEGFREEELVRGGSRRGDRVTTGVTGTGPP